MRRSRGTLLRRAHEADADTALAAARWLLATRGSVPRRGLQRRAVAGLGPQTAKQAPLCAVTRRWTITNRVKI